MIIEPNPSISGNLAGTQSETPSGPAARTAQPRRSGSSSLHRRGARWRFLASVFMISLLPLGVRAGTATVAANCRSLSLHELTGYLSGVGTIYTSITTFDGKPTPPLGLKVDGTFDNSEELRARAGHPGVYEADYVAYYEGVSAYGYFSITLPTTDSDGNGLPDVTQKDKASTADFSGSGTMHYSRVGSPGSFQIINGHLTRAANSVSGTFSFRSIEPSGTIDYSGGFSLNTASGTALYTRGPVNQLTFDLMLADGSTTAAAKGSTAFNIVNPNQITIPQFTLTSAGQSLQVQSLTLNRTGRRYIGDMVLADGYPESSWSDYTAWVIEIEDVNDADSDGIPDLSDAPQNAPPRVWLTMPLSGATFPAPATLTLRASAEDADGSVSQIEFYNGMARLGEDSSAPYEFVCNDLAAGSYAFTAKATDHQGAWAVSTPIRVVVNEDRNKQVIYSTAFEAAEGYDTTYTLAGQNGWTEYGSGVHGLVTNLFPGQGVSAFLGFSASNSAALFLWRPINYTPESTLPLIKFSVQMRIVDSSNDRYDDFLWQLYNSQVKRLFTLRFDNSNSRIYYKLEGDVPYVDTGKTFRNADVHQLLITLDLGANRWGASLDGLPVASQLPITTSDSLVDVGQFAVVWSIDDRSAPGNNFLIFDNYTISAEAATAVPSEIRISARSVSGEITIRAQGRPALAYILQTSPDLRNWTDRQTKTADAQGVAEFSDKVLEGISSCLYRVRQNP